MNTGDDTQNTIWINNTHVYMIQIYITMFRSYDILIINTHVKSI